MKYTVTRQHYGDKLYVPGDEREAKEADVAHLVKNGVLAEMKAPAKKVEAKAAPQVENKAVTPAANKAD